MVWLFKAPVTPYRDPMALARRFEISKSAVGSHENTRKYSESFNLFHSVEMSRRAHGDSAVAEQRPRRATPPPPHPHPHPPHPHPPSPTPPPHHPTTPHTPHTPTPPTPLPPHPHPHTPTPPPNPPHPTPPPTHTHANFFLNIHLKIFLKKSTLLTISRFWRYCGPSNYRFNFVLYWCAPWVFF